MRGEDAAVAVARPRSVEGADVRHYRDLGQRDDDPGHQSLELEHQVVHVLHDRFGVGAQAHVDRDLVAGDLDAHARDIGSDQSLRGRQRHKNRRVLPLQGGAGPGSRADVRDS